jgi:hypothetical protein
VRLESLSKQIEIVQCLGFFYFNLEIIIEIRIGQSVQTEWAAMGRLVEVRFVVWFFILNASPSFARYSQNITVGL